MWKCDMKGYIKNTVITSCNLFKGFYSHSYIYSTFSSIAWTLFTKEEIAMHLATPDCSIISGMIMEIKSAQDNSLDAAYNSKISFPSKLNCNIKAFLVLYFLYLQTTFNSFI